MKVKISVTVEVDTKAWAQEYGVPPVDMRQDVATYFLGHINEAYPLTCGIAKVVR